VVPAHARVASDSVFLHAARWPFGCNNTAVLVFCTAVALSVWWCLPLRSFSAAVFTSVVFRYLFGRVELRFCSVFLSSLSVEFWPRCCPCPTGQCGNPC
jgi:hypothetical protein